MNNNNNNNWVEEIGKLCYEAIEEMVQALDFEEEIARQRIEEDPLSVSVRSDWYSPEEEPPAPLDFEILLSTGGPATRIRGELDQYGQPDRAWLEVQDWGKPWTEYAPADQDVLLRYAQVFYFGEGER